MSLKPSLVLVVLGFILGTIFVDQTVPDCPVPTQQSAPLAPPAGG